MRLLVVVREGSGAANMVVRLEDADAAAEVEEGGRFESVVAAAADRLP